MRVRSSVVTCLVLCALGLPALALPDAQSSESRVAEREAREAKRTEKAAAKAAKKAKRVKRKAARSFTKQLQVGPEQLAERVATLQKELAWHDDLDEARAAARKANKPVLWIHALGDLSGLL